MSFLDKGSKRKLAETPVGKGITIASVALSFYFIWASVIGFPHAILYRGIFVSAMVAMVMLIYTPPGKKEGKIRIIDWIFFALALAVGIYIIINYQRYVFRTPFLDPVYPLDKVFGLLMILLVLEATRRSVGMPLVLVAVVMLAYPFVGKYIPGLFGHRGFTFRQVIEQMFLTTNGIYGEAISICSSYVFMFVIFGSFLNATGGGDFFFDLARSVAGSTRGGLAKTAVVASALFGSISGSPISNVATTGAMTIPMMKKSGYQSHFAGAVETAASCGGTIMPPVMGAVAFLMAEVLGITYFEVLVAAIIPALLYYFAVFFSVDATARRMKLVGEPKGSMPPAWKVFVGGLQYTVPLIWLVFRLFQGLSPSRVALEAVALMIIIALVVRNPKYPINFKVIRVACEDSIRASIPVAVACACAGLVIGIITLTGVGGKFTSLILALGRGYLFPALVLTMLVTIVLGMGMSISPTYLLAASLSAPALIKAGVNPVSAHLFILYYAAMATMTPPVSLAAYTAAGIAEADPMKVGLEAVRIGIVAFVIPYVFVYQPQLILQSSDYIDTVGTVIFTFFGVIALTSGMNQWLLRQMGTAESLIVLISCVLMLIPFYTLNAAGLVILAVVAVRQYLANKRDRQARPLGTA